MFPELFKTTITASPLENTRHTAQRVRARCGIVIDKWLSQRWRSLNILGEPTSTHPFCMYYIVQTVFAWRKRIAHVDSVPKRAGKIAKHIARANSEHVKMVSSRCRLALRAVCPTYWNHRAFWLGTPTLKIESIWGLRYGTHTPISNHTGILIPCCTHSTLSILESQQRISDTPLDAPHIENLKA